MPRRQLAALALLVVAVACRSPRGSEAAIAPASEERIRVLWLDPGARATMVEPTRLDRHKKVELILYALPNGNSTAETMGKRMEPGTFWRYDIQHIAAQTRALRAREMPQAVVVYLEADSKSWPSWRAKLGYPQANARIVEMVNEIRAAVAAPRVEVTLTGHSGGGSLMFGFIEGQEALPPWLVRVAFLDAVYNFEPAHGDKLLAWLRGDAHRQLVSLAYDDREIMLDGKKVVSDSGGTWRATERMIRYLSKSVVLTHDTLGAFDRYRAPQIELLRHPNPGNRILHTEMIGEMNGYMHAMLTGRPGYGRADSLLRPARAYMAFVQGAVALDTLRPAR